MQQKVVIIGHSFTSRLSLIRSVAQLGCEITVIVMTGLKRDGKTPNTKKPIDCYSKYVSHVYYCLRKDKDSFLRLLIEQCTDPDQKVVHIPDSDDTVVAIDNNHERLKDYFVFPHICNGSGSIEYWMDKTHQKEVAKQVGLNVVEGIVIDIRDGKYIIPDGIHYPCYSKPLATMNGGKGGMRRCENVQELISAIDYYINHRTKTGKVLVEDFKEIHQEYALLGFSDGKGVCIPGILKLLAMSEQHKGIARQGMVMPISDLNELVDKFKQFVLKIGFIGVFDIDFYESNGVFYFCEINLRFGGSGYAITKMGVNLPTMMVKHLTGQSVNGMDKTITGTAVYANERMCVDDWYCGFISRKEYHRTLISSDIYFVSDDNDPLPKKIYERDFLIMTMRKIVKDVMKWLHLQ